MFVNILQTRVFKVTVCVYWLIVFTAVGLFFIFNSSKLSSKDNLQNVILENDP